MNEKLNILVIDGGDSGETPITEHLIDEVYRIEIANNWEAAFKKISGEDFQLVICTFRLANKYVTWFLKELEQKNPKLLNIPFIISAAANDDRAEAEKILAGKRLKWLEKDSTDYVYELEWQIINFFPKIFHVFKKRLSESLEASIKVADFADKLKGLQDRIEKREKQADDLADDQETIKEKYIKWESIAEIVGLMVGSITLAIAVAVGLITILVDKKMMASSFQFPLVWLLVIFAVEIIFTFLICYWVFSRRFQRTMEERIDKAIKRRGINAGIN